MAANSGTNLKIETAVEDANIECEPDGNSFWDFAKRRSSWTISDQNSPARRAASSGDLRDTTGHPRRIYGASLG